VPVETPTSFFPLALANGHGYYIAATPERKIVFLSVLRRGYHTIPGLGDRERNWDSELDIKR
jgi:hypothetical protein